MSDYFDSLTNIGDYYANKYNAGSSGSTQKTETDQWWMLPDTPEVETKDNSTLTFEDMLMLMVTQLQNQTIDNQTDTSDMMNQLLQMTVMQALSDMSTQVEDLTNANIMSYSASLVGKEVTVGVVDSKTGKLTDEIVGTVTATGTYNGQQVIFLGDRYYPLSSIMAVGTLPELAVDGTDTKLPSTGEEEDGDKVEGGENAGETEEPKLPVEDEDADIDESEGIEENGAETKPVLPVEDEGTEEDGTDAVEQVSGAAAG